MPRRGSRVRISSSAYNEIVEAISRIELFSFLMVLLFASKRFGTDLFIDASSSSLFIFVVDLRETGLLFLDARGYV